MLLPVLCNESIARLKTGDEASLRLLFQLHYRPLLFFATRLLKDPFVAEDIVEDSFLKLWQRKTDFESLQNIKAFLYITTRNACLNVVKQQQREELSKSQLGYLAGGQSEGFVLNEMVRAEVTDTIAREIDTLPVQCRKILILSFINGYKNQEIADALKISVHTVKNQKIRALQLLKLRLRNSDMIV